MEDDALLSQDAKAMQEIGAALKNVHHAYIQPVTLARGRGQSFRSLGSAKINDGKKNLIGEIKNYNSGASKQKKLAYNKVGVTLKNVRDTFSQPGALARGRGQNIRSSGSAKGSVGKKNLVGESKNHNSTASEQNKLAHNSTNLMPPSFDLMEDDVFLAQEDEMMQGLMFNIFFVCYKTEIY
ncbi:uncharacterized protein [Nicotiana tomentosiformis]|uniref:uncharacterized protein n=1 Tax=Nicotiana tomentosiformis TaxID=4098 RepID=UPI00388C69C8